jgi:hypothetical protein
MRVFLTSSRAGIAEINAEIWELRNLEIFGSNKQGANPGNFTCPARGGAVCAGLNKANARLSIIDSEFRQNSVTGTGTSSYGGALAVYGRSDILDKRLIIENSLFASERGRL